MSSLRVWVYSGILLVAIVLTAGWAVASADEGDEAETFVTVLQPGDNYVGWVAHAAPIEELFEAVPQIELVYTWDADWRRYRYAHPDVPPSSGSLELVTPETPVTIRIGEKPTSVQGLFNAAPRVQLIYRWNSERSRYDFAISALSPDLATLDALGAGISATIRVRSEMSAEELFEALPQVDLIYRYDEVEDRQLYALRGLAPAASGLNTLEPGMGLIVRLGGEDSVEWERARKPAQGMVELLPGRNLVAWMGVDGVAISEAARGVGESLMNLALAGPDRPHVNRGDALWVEVERSVRWPQPTNAMPELVFAGTTSEAMMRDVRGELLSVMEYYRDAFGIQADPSALTVVAARDVGALVRFYREFDDSVSPTTVRALWDEAGGWFSQDLIVIKQHYPGFIGVRKYVLSHEYFHALQYQVSGGSYQDVAWTIEGTANWADSEHGIHDGSHTWGAGQRESARLSAAQGPTIEDVEEGLGHWHYTIGMLATTQLAERAGGNAPLEFFRQQAPSRTGPQGRWHTILHWSNAFAGAFGLSVDEFYDEFDAWQDNLPGRRQYQAAGEGVLLTGVVVRADGTPVADARLIATLEEDADGIGHELYSSSTGTDRDGKFTLPLRSNNKYRIRVSLADSRHNHLKCRVFYDQEHGTFDFWKAKLVSVGTHAPSSIQFTIGDDLCSRRIRGKVLGQDGLGIPGLRVTAGNNLTSFEANGPRVSTELDGSYEIVVPRAGAYRVTVGTEHVRGATGCEIHYSANGSTSSRDGADEVDVKLRDANGIDIVLSYRMCATVVSGVVVRANGDSVPGTPVRLATDETIVSYRADREGSFQMTVPEQGEWYISLMLDGCIVYYDSGSVTGSRPQSRLQLGEKDRFGVVLTVPDELCVTPVSGRLLDSKGAPARSYQMFIGQTWFLTGENGEFEDMLVEPGEYEVYVWLGTCWLYRTDDGWTSESSERTELVVPKGGLTGIEFRLPENPSIFCD